MPWRKGFNFRATSGFVTDPTDTTYVLPGDGYAVTRNSVTFGWNAPVNSADRNSGNDARIAGIHFNSGGGYEFMVDLPNAGDFRVHLAIGDDSGGGTGSQTIDVKDNATTKFSLTTRTYNTPAQFYDASDVARSAAAWPGSEVGVVATFASTTFKLAIGSNGFWVVSHILIEEVVAKAFPFPRNVRRFYRRGF